MIPSTHPPLPPTSEDDKFDCLRLLRSRRVGPATYHRLMTEHGSARAALAALPTIAAAQGVTDYQICPEGVVYAELKAARRVGAQLITNQDPNFPSDLAQVADAPPLLWMLGRRDLLSRPMVALVGARNASSLGTRMAKNLAAGLSEAGYVVVSGLARGIDTAAHMASLNGGTIAVMAGGVDIVYPAENADLAHQIAEKGLRVSEIPMGTTPQARHFPARNRIISGLARAVVVVEAAAKSGSLITARDALDQGREVLSVPGHPMDARAAGCTQLIRDGATLVRSVEDVLEVLGPIRDAPEQPPLPFQDTAPPRPLREVAALHDEILGRLAPAPVAEDQLIRDLAACPDSVGTILTDLEIAGKITRSSGGLLALVH